MFETVNALSKRLPRPVLTGDPRKDHRLREQIMVNAKLLRSEAMACIGRAMLASLHQGWRWLTRPAAAPVSHRA